MIDYAIRGSTNQNIHGESISLSQILLLGSLPFLGLFATGIYSGYLAIKVEEELDIRYKTKKEIQSLLKDEDDYQRQPIVHQPE